MKNIVIIKGVINSKIISGDTNYRKYINDLKKWLNSRNRKPLMILGGLHYEKKIIFNNNFYMVFDFMHRN